jgi:hypothetical protein
MHPHGCVADRSFYALRYGSGDTTHAHTCWVGSPDPGAVLRTLVARHAAPENRESLGSYPPVAGGRAPFGPVSQQRRRRILAQLAATDPSRDGTKRLCQVCAEVTAVTGAGIMLMMDDSPRGSVCTTNAVSTLIDELQYQLGEGPSLAAYDHDRPILEPDLANPATPRWLAFTGPAVDAGVRAVFGFPLRVGAVRLGALHLYRDMPGALTDDQHADALVMADVAATAVLSVQAHAPPGELSGELEALASFQHVVHQASGMVAAQLEITVGEAILRLRGHAFATGRRIGEVARDVVDRELRFDIRSADEDHGS